MLDINGENISKEINKLLNNRLVEYIDEVINDKEIIVTFPPSVKSIS